MNFTYTSAPLPHFCLVCGERFATMKGLRIHESLLRAAGRHELFFVPAPEHPLSAICPHRELPRSPSEAP